MANSAAASAGTVGSHISGNALLVPVDRGRIGDVGAVGRRGPVAVPSPPSTTISAHRPRASPGPGAWVSSAVPESTSSSTNSSAGRRPSLARRLATARATPPATPIPSVETSTRSTPAAPAAASSRTTMLVFSALGNTEACATGRRMSRPDMGLATMPTVEPRTTGSSALVTALTQLFHRAAAPRTRVAELLQPTTCFRGCSTVAQGATGCPTLRREQPRRGSRPEPAQPPSCTAPRPAVSRTSGPPPTTSTAGRAWPTATPLPAPTSAWEDAGHNRTPPHRLGTTGGRRSCPTGVVPVVFDRALSH